MKTQVAVVALHTKDKTIIPLFIVWEHNEKYPIDKILRKERAASLKYGGFGIRYTIRIRGQLRYLYYENPGWFIETCD